MNVTQEVITVMSMLPVPTHTDHTLVSATTAIQETVKKDIVKVGAFI